MICQYQFSYFGAIKTWCSWSGFGGMMTTCDHVTPSYTTLTNTDVTIATAGLMAFAGGDTTPLCSGDVPLAPDALDESWLPEVAVQQREGDVPLLRTCIPASDSWCHRGAVPPACQAATSQPLDVGFDCCGALNKEQTDIITF